MKKTTRILTSAVAVGVIAGSSLISVATPFVHAATIPFSDNGVQLNNSTDEEIPEGYNQVQAVTDLNEHPWLGSDSGDKWDYRVDNLELLPGQNLAGDKVIFMGTSDYKHTQEYVYCRITPTQEDFSVKLKEDLAEWPDTSFYIPKEFSGNNTNVIDTEQAVDSLNNSFDFLTPFVYAGSKNKTTFGTTEIESGKNVSYTLRLPVGAKIDSFKITGVHAEGYGAKVEWYTYHKYVPQTSSGNGGGAW